MADIKRSIILLLVLTLIGGVAYPLAIAAVAQLGGNSKGDVTLIGRNFEGDGYFHGRTAARVEIPGAPADLTTPSASGMDPHISPEAAAFQLSRVAKARHMSEDAVSALVAEHTQGKWLGVFGMPRVNVVRLNAALDNK